MSYTPQFQTNEQLQALRSAISTALAELKGRGELYWLLAAMREADVLVYRDPKSSNLGLTDYVRQMQMWFPDNELLGKRDNEQSEKQTLKNLRNSVSTERKHWIDSQTGEPIAIVNLLAKRPALKRLTGWDDEKIGRVITITYDGLYKSLEELKRAISRKDK